MKGDSIKKRLNVNKCKYVFCFDMIILLLSMLIELLITDYW